MDIITAIGDPTILKVIIAVFTIGIVQAIKQLQRVPDNLLPLLSITIGVIMALVFSFFDYDGLLQHLLIGFVAGAAASGLYDTIKGIADIIKIRSA